MYACISSWTNSGVSSDLSLNYAHCDVTVIMCTFAENVQCYWLIRLPKHNCPFRGSNIFPVRQEIDKPYTLSTMAVDDQAAQRPKFSGLSSAQRLAVLAELLLAYYLVRAPGNKLRWHFRQIEKFSLETTLKNVVWERRLFCLGLNLLKSMSGRPICST